MQIIMRSSMAGPDTVWSKGEVIELPDEAALRLIEFGLAEPVTPPSAPPAAQTEPAKSKRTKKAADGEVELAVAADEAETR